MSAAKTYTVAIMRGGVYGYEGDGAGVATTVKAKTPEAAVVKAALLLGVRNRSGNRSFRPQQAAHTTGHAGNMWAVCGYTLSRSNYFGFASALCLEGVAFDHGTPAEVVIDYAAETANS